MRAIECDGLTRRFGDIVAVDHVSFVVEGGEIFGLLGPNGAGKTTTIRMLMDIFKPDEGRVQVLGEPPGVSRSRIGYLPEERGLYRDLKVLEALVYLAELKGVATSEARKKAMAWLERVDLADWAGHKLKELSRGMHQKVQIVASLVHSPELVVLDEPFQGLDPVNVEMVKEIIRELQAEGTTVVLSTHQMNLVEALCHRILLVHHGKSMLYGPLEDIQRQYAANAVRLRTPSELGPLPGVGRVDRQDGEYILTLENTTPQALLRALVEQDVTVEAFEVATIPLDEIFIAVVKGDEHA
jgi:ABC-2 type transport system ATP-binding protein